MPDFKKANFKFGSNRSGYVTTNNDNFNTQRIYDCMI